MIARKSKDGPGFSAISARSPHSRGPNTLLDTIDLLSRHPGVEQTVRIRVHGNLIGQETEFVDRFTKTLSSSRFASYAGPYDNADVQKLMAACDYVLVPSTWWENSPVVIQEAYAAGRPVICTGIGGMAEKVPNRRAGLHFRLGDGADLARVMIEAADDVLYRALCSGLPEVSDLTAMAREYMATFNRMAKPQTGCGAGTCTGLRACGQGSGCSTQPGPAPQNPRLERDAFT